MVNLNIHSVKVVSVEKIKELEKSGSFTRTIRISDTGANSDFLLTLFSDNKTDLLFREG